MTQTVSEPAWLAGRRAAALERYQSLSVPTNRDEAWRYTGVQPITGTNWTLTPRRPRLSTSAQEGVRVWILPASVRELPADLSSIAATDWNYDRAAHLLERAGFGGTPEEIGRLAAMTPQQAVDALVEFGSIANDCATLRSWDFAIS